MGRAGGIELLEENMPNKRDRDKLIAAIVKALYDVNANEWSIQDKGVLLAAIKLQLKQKPRS